VDGCPEYEKIKLWGGVISPEFTEQELQDKLEKDFKNAIQNILDSTAQSKGYDNILSACSYASVLNDFQTESQKFIVWIASVWSYGYAQLALIKSGGRKLPTIEAFILELPKYEE
jgi:hypothetical protein